MYHVKHVLNMFAAGGKMRKEGVRKKIKGERKKKENCIKKGENTLKTSLFVRPAHCVYVRGG